MKARDIPRLWLVASLLLGVAAACAMAQSVATAPAKAPAAVKSPASAPARSGESFALIVTGQSGSKVYARRFGDWTRRFHAYLTKDAAIPSANVVVMCGDKELVDKKDPLAGALATTDSVAKAILEMSRKVGPQDQFILVMIGHGTLCNSQAQFVLPGPDIDAEQLGKALSSIRAKNQVIMNFSGSSGDFLRVLATKCAQPGRVNIAATRGDEQAEPVFCEFFLSGLETGKARGALVAGAGTKTGPVTLLEAFNWASYQGAEWISRQETDADGDWVVKGKETVALFKKLCEGDEGDPGAQKLSAQADATGPDVIVDLASPKDKVIARTWDRRRIINEHATLDDASGLTAREAAPASAAGGEDFVGATALDLDAGYKPIPAGKAGEQGNLAARTALGKCDRLDVEK